MYINDCPCSVPTGNWLSVIQYYSCAQDLSLTSSYPSESSTVLREEKNLCAHRESPRLNVKKYQEMLALCIIETWFCSGNVLSAYSMSGSGTQALGSFV